MKKFLLVPLFLIGALVALATLPNDEPSPQTPPGLGAGDLSEIKVGDQTLFVEIADNDGKRSKGLGGRESLSETRGMLFTFEKEDYYTFWMKGMQFPLDFIWISADRIVIETTENVPPLSSETGSPPLIKPSQPVRYVLEVNAGWVRDHQIKIGDLAEF